MSSHVNFYTSAIAIIAAAGLATLPASGQAVEGAFTAQQADAGRMAYAAACASCHQDDLRGSGEALPLIGRAFMTAWSARTTKELYDKTHGSMPYGNAGSLGQTTDTNLVAYILQANGAKPGAKALTAAYLKKAKKGSATLPVAIDIRFVGMHGEVRILFELYGCNGSAWNEIDHWEPEMRVVNGSIHENFTYTLLGQFPEEKSKQFRKRFETDLNRALAAMVQAPPPPPAAEDTSETAAIAQ